MSPGAVWRRLSPLCPFLSQRKPVEGLVGTLAVVDLDARVQGGLALCPAAS